MDRLEPITQVIRNACLRIVDDNCHHVVVDDRLPQVRRRFLFVATAAPIFGKTTAPAGCVFALIRSRVDSVRPVVGSAHYPFVPGKVHVRDLVEREVPSPDSPCNVKWKSGTASGFLRNRQVPELAQLLREVTICLPSASVLFPAPRWPANPRHRRRVFPVGGVWRRSFHSAGGRGFSCRRG